jgi:hypothetical protein
MPAPRMPSSRVSSAAMEPRQRMFISCAVVLMRDHIPVPVMGLIALEVVELLRPTRRKRPMVPMPRIKPVVYMPMEPGRPMKPRSRSNKDPTRKPIRPIVPIRRAIIRRIVEVPIWAIRRNANPNPNGNL